MSYDRISLSRSYENSRALSDQLYQVINDFLLAGWLRIEENILLSCLTQARSGCHSLINDFLIFLLSLHYQKVKISADIQVTLTTSYLEGPFNLILKCRTYFQFKWTKMFISQPRDESTILLMDLHLTKILAVGKPNFIEVTRIINIAWSALGSHNHQPRWGFLCECKTESNVWEGAKHQNMVCLCCLSLLSPLASLAPTAPTKTVW